MAISLEGADTQKIGPSAPLKKLLEDYGIKVVIYE